MTITITDLAAELDVSPEGIHALVDQLIGIDGDEATIASTETIRNASGREIGSEITLTAEAAEAIRLNYTEPGAEDLGAELLDDVRRATGAVAVAEHNLSEAMGERDALIRAAWQHGHPRQRIADAAGVTRMRIHQLTTEAG